VSSPTIFDLGERLGLVFHDPDAIGQAFVHASYANENPDLVAGNNERLEFLGDAVLGVIVSRFLYERFPDVDEGGLTAFRASIVNRSSLAALATEIDLDHHLLMGRGELESGGARRPSLLAGVFEALVGAVYLDLGFDATSQAFEPLLLTRLPDADQVDAPKSAKSRLQEWSQQQGGLRPVYELVASEGPAHAQRFTVNVVVGTNLLASGSGSSRQRAEETAAQAALDHLAGINA
jgi:ribonuclease-3